MSESKTAKTAETEIESYKGTSPAWAAYSSALSYTVFTAPFAWAANGLVNLNFDKIFEKIPFKKDTWKRFKALDPIQASIIGGFIAWNAYKEGKGAFEEAKDAERQFNKLSLEHSLYREQLTEAGIKPKDVKFVREVDLRTVKFLDKPTSSHADKIAAEKAAEAEVTPNL